MASLAKKYQAGSTQHRVNQIHMISNPCLFVTLGRGCLGVCIQDCQAMV